MKSLPAALVTHLEARAGVVPRVMVWITARNRSTGAAESLGLWSGDDHREIEVGGETRLYYGAGTVLDVEPVVSSATLEVRRHALGLSAIAPEVEQALRGYDPRLAPVEVHVAHLDPGTDGLVADPVRWIVGWIDEVSITRPDPGGEARAEITIASASRALTRTLGRRKSDRSLRARAAGDRLRRYADVSGAVETVWGESSGRAPKGGGGRQGRQSTPNLQFWDKDAGR